MVNVMAYNLIVVNIYIFGDNVLCHTMLGGGVLSQKNKKNQSLHEIGKLALVFLVF